MTSDAPPAQRRWRRAPAPAAPPEAAAGEVPQFRKASWLGASVGVAYLAAAAWVLAAGWILLVVPDKGPQAIALYAALVVLTALPGGLSLVNSSLLVQEVDRAVSAVSQARYAARDSARTKAEFLATMSHEVRTPLNGIVGYAELLDKTRLDRRQREFTDAIRESSAHLLNIINDVLDYSKIDAGRVELEEKPIDVADLLASCSKAVTVAAAKRGLKLELSIGQGTPPALFGDATRIRQVLLNLLSNAVKFTEAGHIRLGTSAHREADGRYAVSFAVADTGIGMSLQDQKRLFKAFTQVDPSSTRSHGGTGLGLAISQRLCRLMGGDLTVQSSPGKGSTFVATIRAPAAPETVAAAPHALRGVRVLVVDGDPVARTAVAHHAQAWGMLTRSTADPERAVAWIRARDPFDVAVVGHGRGAASAVRLAEALRGAGRAGLPIIVATDSREPFPPDAFVGRIAKPVQGTRLLEAIEAAVDRRPAAPPASAKPASPSDLAILLVEDNVMNRNLALRVLEGLGHHADVAINGLDAVRMVGLRRYDVVLMDVQMPIMDGLEATRAIYHKMPAGTRPVIIGLSANALPGDREQCLRAGMDEYVSKPIDQARVAALLDAVARRRAPRRAEASLVA